MVSHISSILHQQGHVTQSWIIIIMSHYTLWCLGCQQSLSTSACPESDSSINPKSSEWLSSRSQLFFSMLFLVFPSFFFSVWLQVECRSGDCLGFSPQNKKNWIHLSFKLSLKEKRTGYGFLDGTSGHLPDELTQLSEHSTVKLCNTVWCVAEQELVISYTPQT